MQDSSASQKAAGPTDRFLRYSSELRQFLLGRINRSQDAEDVVQEVFLRLLRIPSTEFVRNPRAYIYGIAVHVLREFKMRDVRAGTWATMEPAVLADLADQNLDALAADPSDQIDIQRTLEQALRRLPALQRTVLLMHKHDGYSYEEIAERLKISSHTVDKLLVQAKVRIRMMQKERKPRRTPE